MKNDIKLYRLILNVLFYIFYVLLASLAFSFIFPTILVILRQDVLAPNNPIFDIIQVIILIVVLIFSLVFRKYFYLPIYDKTKIIEKKVEKKKLKTEKKEEKLVEEKELDIKIGKEIK